MDYKAYLMLLPASWTNFGKVQVNDFQSLPFDSPPAYSWLSMRSTLVPVVSFASNWVQWVLLGGILLINIFPQLLLAGILKQRTH